MVSLLQIADTAERKLQGFFSLDFPAVLNNTFAETSIHRCQNQQHFICSPPRRWHWWWFQEMRAEHDRETRNMQFSFLVTEATWHIGQLMRSSDMTMPGKWTVRIDELGRPLSVRCSFPSLFLRRHPSSHRTKPVTGRGDFCRYRIPVSARLITGSHERNSDAFHGTESQTIPSGIVRGALWDN